MSTELCLRYHCLLAMPDLRDDPFRGSVVYLCDHDAGGAMGFVINRVADLTVGELFKQLDLATPVGADRPVLAGGPVSPERGFVLHDGLDTCASLPVGTGLYLSVGRDILEIIAAGAGPQRFELILGYAGWGPGQLEGELLENAWLTGPGDAALVFETALEQRQQAMSARIGFDYRQLSGQAGHA
ncbi:MAG: YqgE/AlgH family protein [Pseudomonadales bacterium]